MNSYGFVNYPDKSGSYWSSVSFDGINISWAIEFFPNYGAHGSGLQTTYTWYSAINARCVKDK